MVRLIGWRGLGINPIEESHVKAVIDRHMHRIAVLTGDVLDMSIRVKKASKSGVVHRFEITIAVATAERVYYASTTDWSITDAVHHAFERIERQIASRLGKMHSHHREPVYPEVA